MKLITIFILCIFSINAYSQFMSVADIKRKNQGLRGVNSHTDIDRCRQVEQDECYNFLGTNLETHKMVNGAFVENPALKAVYDTKIQAKADKKQAKLDRKKQIKDSLKDWDGLSENEKDDILKKLVTELYGD